MPRVANKAHVGEVAREESSRSMKQLLRDIKLSSAQEVNWEPTERQHKSSQVVSSKINTMIRKPETLASNSGIPVAAKGLMRGSFKIAFDNPLDAQAFHSALHRASFKPTYFGENEKYPMVHEGKKLNHIVRFENDGAAGEIPQEALNFLKLKFENDDELAEIIQNMGFERPDLSPGLRFQ